MSKRSTNNSGPIRRGALHRHQDQGQAINRKRRESKPQRESAVPKGPIAILAIAITVLTSLGGALFGSSDHQSGETATAQTASDARETRPRTGDFRGPLQPSNKPAAVAQTSNTAQNDDLWADTQNFDYYVLAVSWSPSYCVERPNSRQCGQGRRFLLHGLWPQNERGYPSNCQSDYRRPSNQLLRRYAPLSASTGLLAHQWRKHGSCSGMPPEDYFRTTAAALKKLKYPSAFQALRNDRSVEPRRIETLFIRANEGLKRDQVTIKCKGRRFSEIRFCMTKDLAFRRCGDDVIRDCGARKITLRAPRRRTSP